MITEKFVTDFLCCPDCRKRALSINCRDHAEILRCAGCDRAYPVRNDVPVLLEHPMIPRWATNYKSFFASQQKDIKACLPQPGEHVASGDKFSGIADSDYHEGRLEKPTLKYSLKRRTQAIAEVIHQVKNGNAGTLLEAGCADGLMTSMLS